MNYLSGLNKQDYTMNTGFHDILSVTASPHMAIGVHVVLSDWHYETGMHQVLVARFAFANILRESLQLVVNHGKAINELS